MKYVDGDWAYESVIQTIRGKDQMIRFIYTSFSEYSTKVDLVRVFNLLIIANL